MSQQPPDHRSTEALGLPRGSIRAILALVTVVSGLVFLYLAAFLLADADLRLVIITAVVGFINLALGFYLGQKTAQQAVEEAAARVDRGDR